MVIGYSKKTAVVSFCGGAYLGIVCWGRGLTRFGVMVHPGSHAHLTAALQRGNWIFSKIFLVGEEPPPYGMLTKMNKKCTKIDPKMR